MTDKKFSDSQAAWWHLPGIHSSFKMLRLVLGSVFTVCLCVSACVCVFPFILENLRIYCGKRAVLAGGLGGG